MEVSVLPHIPAALYAEKGHTDWQNVLEKKKALCYAGMRNQVGLASRLVTVPTTNVIALCVSGLIRYFYM